MKISLIIKIVGTMHLVLGIALWGMLIFAADIVAPGASPETIVAVQGTADVVGAHSVGIGLLLIVLSFIKDIESARLVLVGELVLMIPLLFIALFNTFHPYWGPEYSGPPPPFWLIIVLNPSLCIYGYYKGT